MSHYGVNMKKIVLEGQFGWMIESRTVREQLNDAGGEDLDVHLASPGGSVFEGIKVFNLFRDYRRDYPKSQNMLTIKGLAASMASYFAMNPAFELVAIEDNAVFMLHNPYGLVSGDYREAEKFANMLKGLTDILALAYIQKTKKPKKEIREMMDNETWFFGEEIVRKGFADEIIKTDKKKEKAEAITMAKMEFAETKQKIREIEAKEEDILEIAAMLNNSEANNDHTPADDAGENKIGGVIMTLEELKAKHPAIYDEIFNLGKEAGVKEVQDIAGKVEPFLNNSEYPKEVAKNMTEVGIKVIKGEKSFDVLDSMVVTADMIKETVKSEKAAGETPEDTPIALQNNQISEEYKVTGTIMNEADMIAEEKRIKQANGMEV